MVISGHTSPAKFLLEQGADVNNPTNSGETPLHHASDNSNYQLASLLLQYGGDPNFQQNEGETPLHYSAFHGDPEMMQLLLDNGGNPNIKNKVVRPMQTGRTPLHYAVDCGYLSCVEIMIKAEADPEIRDNQNKTAFDLTTNSEILMALACKKNEEEIKEVEVEYDEYDCGPEEFYLERNSYSKEKLDEILKSIKSETTAVSSSKSTKQNRFELKPIYDWLDKVQLTDYYELISCSGYETVEDLLRDPANLSLSVLNYIAKPGHRRKLLFKIQEEGINRNKPESKVLRPEKKNYLKCCGSPGYGTQAIYSFPSMKEWLAQINMEIYYNNFADAGYEDFETLVKMVNTEFALDSQILQTEVKICKEQQIKRILRKLESDNLTLCSRRSIQIAFDEPKSAACETCGIF